MTLAEAVTVITETFGAIEVHPSWAYIDIYREPNTPITPGSALARLSDEEGD